MIEYDKEKIRERIKLEENEEPIFMINFDPIQYTIRSSFFLYFLFIIYIISFIISTYYNPNLISFILLIFITSLIISLSISYYNKVKNYFIVFTNKRLIQIINENYYSIQKEDIYNVEISQNIYEKIRNLYSIKIYTSTLLINKNINLTIEIPLLKKEDIIKIRDKIIEIVGKPELQKKLLP
ncbi:MAG: PH domain-containing protein [Nanopusillaceae archaeon]